jgi:hypothetical protein
MTTFPILLVLAGVALLIELVVEFIHAISGD